MDFLGKLKCNALNAHQLTTVLTEKPRKVLLDISVKTVENLGAIDLLVDHQKV